MEWSGFRTVLYCDLESTLSGLDLNADALARFAIESVRNNPARNAIRYLAQNIGQGVITPLTYDYREAIFARHGRTQFKTSGRIAAPILSLSGERLPGASFI
jgi:hypothetical protein